MVSEQDLVYLKILVISFVASFGVKHCPKRDIVSGCLGLGLVFYICEYQLFYSFVIVAINLAIINFLDVRRVHIISFGVCFSYVTFFRCAHYFGLPKALPYANAVQLIMTLRCVGLAFEIHDAKKLTDKEDKYLNRIKHSTIWDQFFYCYNFVGLFTGPYFSFRVHLDNIYCRYLLTINYANHLTSRILLIPCYIILFLIAQTLFPLEVVHSEEFYNTNGFFYRLCYMVPIFFQLRMRCYVAWTLSESACIVAGIGAYPNESKPKCGQGPTDIKKLSQFETQELAQIEGSEFSFETIKNIDPAGCEFAGTFRDAMRYWNRSVQYWLATYIYRRTPKNYNRAAITMLVSAYWHGVHPGYYLSFMTIPLCLFVEDLMFSCFGPKQEKVEEMNNCKIRSWDQRLSTTFEKLWWFFRVRGFEYMAMGFLLLSWNSTVTYWKSIGFALHVCLLILLFIGLIMKYIRRRREGKSHVN